MRIKLVVPLKKSLAEKRKAMEAALKAYTQAADYQVAEVTTAATYDAELYPQFGKDLMSSERPKNLSKDEVEQYNVLLGSKRSIRGEGDQIARGECRARQGGYLRRVSAEEFCCAGTTQPGPLRQGGNQ